VDISASLWQYVISFDTQYLFIIIPQS